MTEPSWDELLDQFANYLTDEGRSPLTIRNYRRELRAFVAWYRAAYPEMSTLWDLEARDLEEFKDHLKARKLMPASINLAIVSIRSFLNWAGRPQGSPGTKVKTKLIEDPPRAPRMIRERRKTPRWLKKPQERRLLKAVRLVDDPHHVALIDLFLVFGLRISEMAGLEWSDVAMGRKHAVLRVRHAKGGKERSLPFMGNRRARDAFLTLGWKEHHKERDRRILQGQRGPLTASGLKQLLKPYGKLAEIPKFSAHVLRHTCARRMHEKGESLDVIKTWMGHESIDTTILYTLPSEDDLARAAGGGAEWDDDWSGADD
jgi:site-specific recombinase XerD